MNLKVRVDQLLVERGLAKSREAALRLILAGLVRANDRVLDKPGMKIPFDTPVNVENTTFEHVSMGALKLERALEVFQISPNGMKCLDIGASTGGFTEVLLLRGATHVTALDVGYGQLAWKLRNDPRVTCIERTNFRLISDNFFSNPFELIVADVSFISLTLILPKAKKILSENGTLLALIKPQFEAGRNQVEKRGIVKDSKIHQEVIRKLRELLKAENLFLQGLVAVPRVNIKKNIEFFSWWKTNETFFSDERIASVIAQAHNPD